MEKLFEKEGVIKMGSVTPIAPSGAKVDYGYTNPGDFSGTSTTLPITFNGEISPEYGVTMKVDHLLTRQEDGVTSIPVTDKNNYVKWGFDAHVTLEDGKTTAPGTLRLPVKPVPPKGTNLYPMKIMSWQLYNLDNWNGVRPQNINLPIYFGLAVPEAALAGHYASSGQIVFNKAGSSGAILPLVFSVNVSEIHSILPVNNSGPQAGIIIDVLPGQSSLDHPQDVNNNLARIFNNSGNNYLVNLSLAGEPVLQGGTNTFPFHAWFFHPGPGGGGTWSVDPTLTFSVDGGATQVYGEGTKQIPGDKKSPVRYVFNMANCPTDQPTGVYTTTLRGDMTDIAGPIVTVTIPFTVRVQPVPIIR